jgi:hypothetical protein
MGPGISYKSLRDFTRGRGVEPIVPAIRPLGGVVRSGILTFARSFGVRGLRLDADRAPLAELAAALAEPGPCVIDIPIHEHANVLPMVPPGAANRQMLAEPELEPAAHA